VGGGPHLEVGEGNCDKRGDYKKDQEHKQQDAVELGGHAHNNDFFLERNCGDFACALHRHEHTSIHQARAYINLQTYCMARITELLPSPADTERERERERARARAYRGELMPPYRREHIVQFNVDSAERKEACQESTPLMLRVSGSGYLFCSDLPRE
jgi:hypothetical protein